MSPVHVAQHLLPEDVELDLYREIVKRLELNAEGGYPHRWPAPEVLERGKWRFEYKEVPLPLPWHIESHLHVPFPHTTQVTPDTKIDLRRYIIDPVVRARADGMWQAWLGIDAPRQVILVVFGYEK